MVKRIVGLAGRSGAGKDWTADLMCRHYGYRKIAVADGIRDECHDFIGEALATAAFGPYELPESFDVVLRAFEQAVYDKPTTPEIRVLLQWWGTEFRRSQDSDYWVKRLAERLRVRGDGLIVVSDVRLPDEIKVIRAAGGEVWFLDRPNLASVGLSNHATETGLTGCTFDRTIQNDSTLQDLEEKIHFIIREC